MYFVPFLIEPKQKKKAGEYHLRIHSNNECNEIVFEEDFRSNRSFS